MLATQINDSLVDRCLSLAIYCPSSLQELIALCVFLFFLSTVYSGCHCTYSLHLILSVICSGFYAIAWVLTCLVLHLQVLQECLCFFFYCPPSPVAVIALLGFRLLLSAIHSGFYNVVFSFIPTIASRYYSICFFFIAHYRQQIFCMCFSSLATIASRCYSITCALSGTSFHMAHGNHPSCCGAV